MKYRCLILDHDDTVVDSTATLHYPSFIEFLKIYRPSLTDNYTFESFIRKNFEPGIVSLLRDEVGLDDEEMKVEERFWLDFAEKIIPDAYRGIGELMADFRARGGIIAVSSHSFSKNILRDYEKNGLPLPDKIYGWELPRDRRKPATFTVDDLIATYGFRRSEILMVDDLKPGFDMASAAGIDFAAAGWAYDVPEVEAFLRERSTYYLRSVAELRDVLGI